MLNETMAKVIQCLPEGIVSFLSKKIVNSYINKYANIILEGGENLKNFSSPVIFVSNHLSNSDGLILNKILERFQPTFVAGKKLSENSYTNLGRHVVNTITIKPNTADKDAISLIVKTIRTGGNIMIFPEGTRSRCGTMIAAKKGIVLIQKLTKVPIVPIGIYGTEKLLPINNDMGNERFNYADVHVKIGNPIQIPLKTKEEDKHLYEDKVLQMIMKSISKLIPEEYRGVYK